MQIPAWREQAGLALVEILVAVAIIVIGLIAVMQAFPFGIEGMDAGRRHSTAVFLAEQKIDQIRAWALSVLPTQGFASLAAGGACFTAPDGPCRSDVANTIPGYPEYGRTVLVQNGPTATTKLIRVQVSYRPVTTQGVLASRTRVDIATVIAQH